VFKPFRGRSSGGCGVESVFSEESVEPDEEFSGAGDDGELLGFSAFEESLVKVGDVGVVLTGGDGGHVEGFANASSSAVDVT
jgi:hypothetical protein